MPNYNLVKPLLSKLLYRLSIDTKRRQFQQSHIKHKGTSSWIHKTILQFPCSVAPYVQENKLPSLKLNIIRNFSKSSFENIYLICFKSKVHYPIRTYSVTLHVNLFFDTHGLILVSSNFSVLTEFYSTQWTICTCISLSIFIT